MRILNLYAGIGGNRKLWGDEHEIVAVEYDPKIAQIYQDHFPHDTMIVADAHQYLLEHYTEFDFIWSSPPCQSHSSIRHNRAVKFLGSPVVYPDMRLYEEILLLTYNAPEHTKWVVENVNPYYGALIPAQKVNRHLYWANFVIPDFPMPSENLRAIQIPELERLHGFDLSPYSGVPKRQLLRNCVPGPVGEHILLSAIRQAGK